MIFLLPIPALDVILRGHPTVSSPTIRLDLLSIFMSSLLMYLSLSLSTSKNKTDHSIFNLLRTQAKQIWAFSFSEKYTLTNGRMFLNKPNVVIVIVVDSVVVGLLLKRYFRA